VYRCSLAIFGRCEAKLEGSSGHHDLGREEETATKFRTMSGHEIDLIQRIAPAH
jgi:hypothetical protein